MQARFKDKISVKLDVEAPAEHVHVPTFLLQPLVENAIRHSLDQADRVEITFNAAVADGRLVMILQDNGQGISGDKESAARQGTGLSNTVQRLESLYGADHAFQLENRPEGGLRIRMEIPVRQTEK